MTARFIVGDVLEVLPTLEENSVDLILTSPPFLALRSYLPADHPDKAKEGGSQPTPGAFIDWLVDVVEALDRVLAPHGSMCLELGDTFSGSGGAGGDYADAGWRNGQPKFGGSASRTRSASWSFADAKWLAGVLDTEGSIYVHRMKREPNPSFVVWVRVTMMDREVCDRAALITGVGSVTQDKRGAYTWTCSAQQARYVLLHIWPYLLIKQRQAKACIELARHIEESERRGRYAPLSAEQLAFREMVKEHVTGWNLRGEQRDSFMATWEPPHPPHIQSPILAGPEWPADKSLALIPELFRFTLVYGFNPLTGRQTKRWRLRNVVRWVRPNPPVGALGDKFRPATSELMVFCRTDEAGRRRFFDLDAVREPGNSFDRPETRQTGGVKQAADPLRQSPGGFLGNPAVTLKHHPAGAPPLDWWNIPGDEDFFALNPHFEPGWKPKAPPQNIPLLDGEEETPYGPRAVNRDNSPGGIHRGRLNSGDANRFQAGEREAQSENNPAGAPPLDWWNIPPGGYQGAHYAVFPEALCVRPIKAMCPERVCRTCGEPSRRIVDHYRTIDGVRRDDLGEWNTPDRRALGVRSGNEGIAHTRIASVSVSLGWTDCGHDNYRPGLVLDPFAGSGTTLAVAVGHGRDAIGIDLDERNLDLARERIGMFLEASA